MGSLIFTLITVLFVPFWIFGGFFNFSKSNTAVSENKSCPNEKGACVVEEGKVLGKEKDNVNFNSYNSIPVGKVLESGFSPVRKNGTSDLKLWAGSSVVIDADSGTILHYDNGKKRTQIASLTKMMTAVLVMENVKDLEEPVTITKEALYQPGTVVGCPRTGYCLSNRMYIGEKIKAIDLMKAMLMNSANDAATALGVHIAGSMNKFVDMMNEKAKSLGFNDTNFCTPSGLEIDGQEDRCYSTAYDISRIAAYSMKYDKIWEIMKIPEGRFYSCDGKYMHELRNTDILVSIMPNCIGGKTGFTPLAGKSLLTGASDPTGKHKIIAVVLNDERRWDDMKSLVDWVFASYKWE